MIWVTLVSALVLYLYGLTQGFLAVQSMLHGDPSVQTAAHFGAFYAGTDLALRMVLRCASRSS